MSFSDHYSKYPCWQTAPLSCESPHKTAQAYRGAKFCMECGFPTPLPLDKEIRGQRGTYQIKRYLGSRGWGRLYGGVRLANGQSVIIKEYLLPQRYFTPEAARQRQELFTQLAGLTPADGKTQEFRLVPIVEALADQQEPRCYLITAEPDDPISLRTYLSQQGTLSAADVRTVLDHGLQTLQFLHSQKFRRPSGHIDQGVAHGNLSLDSVLWVSSTAPPIYLSDLADWELLFQPDWLPSPAQPSQDLVALGQVAFDLWIGTDALGQSLDPRESQHWPVGDPGLKHLILRLMGIEQPFQTAEMARQALRQMAPEPTQVVARAAPSDAASPRRINRWLFGLGGGGLLLLAASGLWVWLNPDAEGQPAAHQPLPHHTLAEVGGIEPGRFTYLSEAPSTWSFVLNQTIHRGKTLKDRLLQPKPDVAAEFIHRGQTSEALLQGLPSPLLARVQQDQSDFAITSLTEPLPDELEQVPIAYDGLLVFVPFNKGQNLPKALRGQMQLDTLRQLYLGEITNWRQLGGPDLPVVTHGPTEPEAVRLFERLVLQDDPAAIARFRQQVKFHPTNETLRQGRPTFAAGEAGIISFGILSKTWNQCGGYPLALATQDQPVQALAQPSGQPIDIEVNLCGKGIHLNGSAFRSGEYPLSFPLSVVYPKGNQDAAGRQFAELLRSTQEGQCLLQAVGLVPLQPIASNCESIDSPL